MTIKKIAAGFALVTVIALLVAGGINRTLSKTDRSISVFNQDETYSSGRWKNEETSSNDLEESTAKQEQVGREQDQGGGRWNQENSGPPQSESQPNNVNPADDQADVQEWVYLYGTVSDVDSSYLFITADDGTAIEVGGRPWSYIQSQAFLLETGSAIALQGFYETDDRFEIGVITNLSTGEDIAIRDQTGRPMWAGGRRGGQDLDG
jgi:hypothetical protein